MPRRARSRRSPCSRSRRCSPRPSGGRTTRPRSARSSSEGSRHGNRRDHHPAPHGDGGKGAARKLRAPGRCPPSSTGRSGRGRTSASTRMQFERRLGAPRGLASDPPRAARAGRRRAARAHGAAARDAAPPGHGRVLHADFYEVDLTERLVVSVPLHFTSARRPAWSRGGILQPILREIEVECLPTEIPEFIEVDVTRARHPRGRPSGGPEAARRRRSPSARRPRRWSRCCRRPSRPSPPRPPRWRRGRSRRGPRRLPRPAQEEGRTRAERAEAEARS